MKNIFAIISAFLFIAGSVAVNMVLSDGSKDVAILIKQNSYKPASAHLCNVKIESLPLNKCNPKNQVEDAHVTTTRFASARKIISRHIFFAPLFFLSKHSAAALAISNKAQPNFVLYTVKNLPLHIRNCSWMI